MKGFVMATLVSWTALAACSDDKSETKAVPGPTVTQPKLADKPAAPMAASELEPPPDLPVPADFEQEAETSITKSNYDKELEMLEKEIAADVPK